ncbi:uncharacterized protein LOC127131406 [Lathyrus oleraceus]|uniref:uncharacterized protein LOC127131406 n=1 Tax=Pisum sativum TaxID=3888 RepID=UPI0021CF6016|nr:uncharacterized protein LOC127131406 [Pisum sativum]
MDVKSTFLNGPIDEEVYVSQPPGFELKGKDHMMYILYKALYGQKLEDDNDGGRVDATMYKHMIGSLRSKHIETRFHYIREQMNKGRLIMRYCHTKDQIIDILTKVEKEEQFSKLDIDMGMVAFDSEVGITSRSIASKALMASESTTSEGFRDWNSLAFEEVSSKGVRGCSNMAYEVLIAFEPSSSKGVRGGNYI